MQKPHIQTNQLEYYKKCLEESTALHSGAHIDVATASNNLGVALYRNGDVDTSITYFRNGFNMLKTLGYNDHPDVATILSNLGLAYEYLAKTKNFIGQMLGLSKGSYEYFKTSLLFQEQSLKMWQDLYQYDHPDVADSLAKVGGIYYAIGDAVKGEEYVKRACIMSKKVTSKDYYPSKLLEIPYQPLELGFLKNNESEIIRQRGKLDTDTLEIKVKIQDILNKISSLAPWEGTWQRGFFLPYSVIDWGVGSYISKSYLSKTLGAELGSNSIKIAQMLCFEAICLGIMSVYGSKNLACAQEFYKAYPKLIEEIESTHPEYFVDGVIKSLIKNPEKIKELPANNTKEAVVDSSETNSYWWNSNNYEYSGRMLEMLIELRLETKNSYDVHKIEGEIITQNEDTRSVASELNKDEAVPEVKAVVDIDLLAESDPNDPNSG